MTNTSNRISPDRGSITMFTGKGGVGKTTCAAATALHYAFLGKRTLAISTDATPSLSHIFEIGGHKKPAAVNEHLYINEIGEQETREMWDKKFGHEVYEVFSSFVAVSYPEFVEFMTSMLPGLGEEFMVDYIRELKRRDEYDAIVWDTAPLGQTLALLKTPSMLSKHLRMAPRIYSKLRLGPQSREPILDILRRWESLSAENMAFLKQEVRFVMVTIPEALAVEQLETIIGELSQNDFKLEQLIINNVVKADGSDFMLSKSGQRSCICFRFRLEA
jgi:arsenite-transporting ATPase